MGSPNFSWNLVPHPPTLLHWCPIRPLCFKHLKNDQWQGVSFPICILYRVYRYSYVLYPVKLPHGFCVCYEGLRLSAQTNMALLQYGELHVYPLSFSLHTWTTESVNQSSDNKNIFTTITTALSAVSEYLSFRETNAFYCDSNQTLIYERDRL